MYTVGKCNFPKLFMFQTVYFLAIISRQNVHGWKMQLFQSYLFLKPCTFWRENIAKKYTVSKINSFGKLYFQPCTFWRDIFSPKNTLLERQFSKATYVSNRVLFGDNFSPKCTRLENAIFQRYLCLKPCTFWR